MSLRELNYPTGAQWVLARCTEKTTLEDVTAALHALANAAAEAEADCALDGLFPGSRLEVLYSRNAEGARDPVPPAAPDSVEPAAMRAIGEAITKEMVTTGKRLLTMSVSGYGEITVFPPELRSTVLMGLQTTLLDS